MRGALIFLALCLVGLGGCASSRPPSHLVSGRGMEKTQPDRVAQRRVVLTHPQSKEALDLVYFRNGRYDSAAMKKINWLMRDRHKNAVRAIDPELIDYLVDLRRRLMLPETVPFQILSGYRAPSTNANLASSNGNVATESLHMYGWAVDFRIDGINGQAIAEIAKTMQRGGVAYYPSSNHLHVDLGNIRTWKEKGR